MSGRGKVNVFVVGNDEFVSELLAPLSRIDYTICASGETTAETMNLIESCPAEIVILDLPGDPSTNTAHFVKELKAKVSLPIILITGAIESTSAITRDADEPIEQLARPFDDRLLRATIQLRLLQHQSQGQQTTNDGNAQTTIEEASQSAELANLQLDAERRKRQDLERHLQTAEERFHLALLASRQGLWEWNLITGDISVGPNFLEFSGFSPPGGPINFAFIDDRIHPDDLSAVHEALGNHLRGETDVSIAECRIRRTSGQFHWIRAVGKVVEWNADGKPIRLIGSISNIEERKRTELSLRQFRQAVECANSGIILVDVKAPDQPITFVNPAFTILTGYSAEESIGRNCRFLAGSDNSQSGQKELREAFAEGRSCRTVLRNYRKDGTLFWNDVNVAPVIGHSGEISHFFGVLHDITARKEAEDAVRRSRAKLSVTLDSISDAVLATDLDGCVTLINPVAERLTGWSQAEALGLPATLVYRVWDSQNQLRPTFQLDQLQKDEGSEDSGTEKNLETRDGQRRQISESAALIRDQDGTVSGVVLVFRDVTKEQAATGQIRSLLKDLNDIKVALDEHSIVSIADAEGRITYVNDKFCRIVKATREALIGQSYEILESGHHSKAFFNSIQRTVAAGRTWQGEVLCRASDESRFWVDATLVPFLDHDGKPYQYVVINSDITARKLAEDRIRDDIAIRKQAEEILQRSNDELEKLVNDRASKLRESEERLRIFIENVPAGVAMFDREMRYLAHSHRWRTDYRLGEQNLIGRSHYDCFPQLPEHYREIHNDCLNGVAHRCEEDAFTLPDGSVEYFRWEIQPWRDSFGVVGGLVLFNEMITEKRLALMALQESEDRFRQIATSIDHVFWIYLLPEKRHLYVSPSYEQIFGQTVAELYADSNSWMKQVHPEDSARLRKELRVWGQNPTETKLDFRILRHGSELRWICIRGISVRHEAGSRIRISGVVEDITEKKLAESQALQSQKLQAVGQFAAGIAHDFNNFLLLISCYSDQLLTQLEEENQNRRAVIAIRDAGARAARLTSQLLAFSRKQVLEIVTVDVNELIVRATQLMRGAIRDDVCLNLDLSSEPAIIDANPGQVDQVILNLILNAQDAMPYGGQVTVSTRHDVMPTGRNASDSHPAEQCSVRLTVSDTGTGMTEEIKSRIFDPYFTTKSVGKGTGLGLSVVQGIVSQSGGLIQVESIIDAGTDLIVHFPASSNQVAAQIESVRPPATTWGTESVLLVEDEDQVRHALKSALESQGYHVLDAAHGPAAIAMAVRHERPIDLLITDIRLPELSGTEVARSLAEVFPELPTIFMSGHADDEVLFQVIREKAHSYLQKPFEKSELFLKIRELLNRQVKCRQ